MLAERFPGLLPLLRRDELLEVVKIHSISGLNVSGLLAGIRPFRAPHYSASLASLMGGGTNARPGEVSLAHRGVLFLDEFPEYPRPVIEALRLPLENGTVHVGRVKCSIHYPARFQLLSAMNPCPCGRLGATSSQCMCSPSSIASYLKKLSQPILDRIDIHVDLQAVPLELVAGGPEGDEQQDQNLRKQVSKAHELQYARSGKLNSELRSAEIFMLVALSSSMRKILEQAGQKLGLSARGYVRVCKVARTIADLESEERVNECHLAEALGYHALNRIEQYCAIK